VISRFDDSHGTHTSALAWDGSQFNVQWQTDTKTARRQNSSLGAMQFTTVEDFKQFETRFVASTARQLYVSAEPIAAEEIALPLNRKIILRPETTRFDENNEHYFAVKRFPFTQNSEGFLVKIKFINGTSNSSSRTELFVFDQHDFSLLERIIVAEHQPQKSALETDAVFLDLGSQTPSFISREISDQNTSATRSIAKLSAGVFTKQHWTGNGFAIDGDSNRSSRLFQSIASKI
jgi:hypothetical protein